jgi:hypothetical protein
MPHHFSQLLIWFVVIRIILFLHDSTIDTILIIHESKHIISKVVKSIVSLDLLE